MFRWRGCLTCVVLSLTILHIILRLGIPVVDNLHFCSLSHLEGDLIKSFSLEEVKAVISNYDGFKSPGLDRLDDINFSFIKDFWPEIKYDTVRFISEFHCNDKLTKGINCTFIALIPKVDIPQCLNDFRPISLVEFCIRSWLRCSLTD
jgi:hypothetical protein